MLLTPVLLLLVLVAVQAALVFHARSVVTAAAQDAARATQRELGTEADGRAAAAALLDSSQQLLVAPTITIDRTTDTVTARVESEVTSVIPFWTPSVEGAASGPVEQFRNEAER